MYPPSHIVAPYSGAPRATSRSRLSDNILRDPKGAFNNPDITLVVRQEPKEALVLSSGKEKSRKPVDPPPIIQLKVNEDVEVSQHFLQSPYLFLVADLWRADKDERFGERASQSASYLYGGLSSSLHRLKDVDNKDAGFFIFGDISVRATGTFRLRFSLYDLQKEHNAAVYLGSIMTQPFKVLAAKDFQGLEESTYLSRAFSDQGVRLRLRKEPRAFAGSKRAYYSDGPQPSAPARSDNSFYDNESPQHKRFRADTDDRKDNYTDQVVTPQHQVVPPQHQVIPPQHQIIPPQHQVIPSQHQVVTSQSTYPSTSYSPAPQASYPTTNFTTTMPQASYTNTYTSGLQPTYPSSYTGTVPQPSYYLPF